MKCVLMIITVNWITIEISRFHFYFPRHSISLLTNLWKMCSPKKAKYYKMMHSTLIINIFFILHSAIVVKWPENRSKTQNDEYKPSFLPVILYIIFHNVYVLLDWIWNYLRKNKGIYRDPRHIMNCHITTMIWYV